MWCPGSACLLSLCVCFDLYEWDARTQGYKTLVARISKFEKWARVFAKICHHKGWFTLAKFVGKTVSGITPWLLYSCLCQTLQIEMILSVSQCPRWPRQVQYWLSHVFVACIFAWIAATNFASVNTPLDPWSNGWERGQEPSLRHALVFLTNIILGECVLIRQTL